MAKTPLVSVMMPAYNCAPFIGESITSVLRQNHDNLELLILDDGSTDGTWGIVKKFIGDPRVRAARQRHRGVGPARNRLAAMAKGEFLVPHDADDIMLSGRLRRQADYLRAHPGVGLVFSDHLLLDPTRKPPLSFFITSPQTAQNRFMIPESHHGASMFRKKVFLKTSGYDENYRMGEDSDMWMKLYEKTRFHFLKGPVFIWRINPRGMTRTRGFIEEDHEAMLRLAVRRRSQVLRPVSIRIGPVAVSFTTNSASALKLVQNSLYLDGRQKADKTFSCECYEIGHIGGLYGHLRFKIVDEETSFFRSTDGERLFWKSPKGKFIVKIDRRAGTVLAFISSAAAFNGDALVDLLFTYPLIFLTRPMGWHFIHAAVLAKGNKGLLITGPSLSGKTTLSMAFVKNGMKLLSDETNILECRKGVVRAVAFPRKVQVKRQAFTTFPELRSRRWNFFQTRHNTAKNKWMMPIEVLRKNARQGSAELKLVLFPRYRAVAKPRYSRVGESELLRLLSGDKNYYVEFGMEKKRLLDYLLLLRALQRQAAVYRVEYSNEHWDELLRFAERHL